MRTRLTRSWPWLLVLLLALPAVAPLLQPGYFWGAHDARHDVYFLFQFDQAVQEGNWFPRWGPDWAFGYGYPFWIIYAPLSVMLGEACHHFLGLGWEASVKAVLGLSIVLSGLGMYGFVRSWLGRRAGLVAAVAYMVVPYHLVDLYVRAAVPEALALALLPLVLWGFRETVTRPRLPALLGAALAYACLWWTHNLTAAILTPVLAVYLLVLACGQRGAPFFTRLAAPAGAGLLGLALAAGFLAPALLESKNVNQAQWFGSYYSPFQHFVYFNQFFNPGWGFGISRPGPDDVALGSLSYQLGAVPFVLALVGLVASVPRLRGRRRELWALAAWCAGAVFLTLGPSAPLWQLPVVPYAQFPWRYLLLAVPPLCVLAGTVVAAPAGEDQAPSDALDWPAFLLVALLLLGSYPYLRVEMREPTLEQGPVSYAALMRFQRTSNEMTGVTAWVDPAQIPAWSPMADSWIAGQTVTTKVDYGQRPGQVPQNARLAVNAEGLGSDYEEIWYHAGEPGQSITFNRFWYPGWKLYTLDGRHGRVTGELPVEMERGPLARVVVPVPPGEGFLLLRFADTPLRSAARVVTYAAGAVALALLVMAAVSRWRRQVGR